MTVPIRITRKIVRDCLLHPQWTARVMLREIASSGMPRFVNMPREVQTNAKGGGVNYARSDNLTWADLCELRARWHRPLLVKGILHPEDAKMAIACGADGVIVSNHGGRSLDAVPATLDMLPQIADVVGTSGITLVDGGIRRGTDLAKALALGADAILLGRAPLWGLAAGGEAGADKSLQILRTELDRVLGLTGCKDIEEMRRTSIRRLSA